MPGVMITCPSLSGRHSWWKLWTLICLQTISQEKCSVPVLAGVNCRNLSTLAVDFERFSLLAPHLPQHLPVVAESGIDEAAQVR